VEAQGDGLVVTVEPAALHGPQEHQLRAELLRLPAREPCKLRAANPVGKTEEVLDPTGVRGLAARHVRVAHERRQTVGGRVDRRGETGGARSDHDEVVLRAPGRLQAAPRTRDGLDGRSVVHRAVLLDEDGQVGITKPGTLEQFVCPHRSGLEPVVRLGRAREEVAQAIVLRLQAPADDLHLRPDGTHVPMVVAP
jgi:hypothetical protein